MSHAKKIINMMNIFKPKEKKTFEILLDEDSRYVHPGQEVKGHVILNFKGPEPIKTKGIKVGAISQPTSLILK